MQQKQQSVNTPQLANQQYFNAYTSLSAALTNTIHADCRINVAKVDPQTGTVTGTPDVYAMAGFLRRLGQADGALHSLAQKKDSQCRAEPLQLSSFCCCASVDMHQA
eukprot:998-Heterococcus_DN1.PRE.3